MNLDQAQHPKSQLTMTPETAVAKESGNQNKKRQHEKMQLSSFPADVATRAQRLERLSAISLSPAALLLRRTAAETTKILT